MRMSINYSFTFLQHRSQILECDYQWSPWLYWIVRWNPDILLHFRLNHRGVPGIVHLYGPCPRCPQCARAWTPASRSGWPGRWPWCPARSTPSWRSLWGSSAFSRDANKANVGVSERHAVELEDWIEEYTVNLLPLENLILPGGGVEPV